jgi:5-methylcytosine-specific restriction endonuclease McrA
VAPGEWPERPPCLVCDQPVRLGNQTGICQRTPECSRESRRIERQSADPDQRRRRRRAYYAANAAAVAEYAKAWRQANRARERERQRRWRAANPETVRARHRRQWAKLAAERPEVVREKQRRYLQRTDRPCRYARAGCPEFAIPWSHSCYEHDHQDHARRRERKRLAVATRLAQMQHWTCTWCSQPLPEDLTGTVVDHVIPQSAGGPDEPWNFELLHVPCNGPAGKWHKIIPKALELAAQHGLQLTSAVA